MVYVKLVGCNFDLTKIDEVSKNLRSLNYNSVIIKDIITNLKKNTPDSIKYVLEKVSDLDSDLAKLNSDIITIADNLDNSSPDSIATAYARISRSPKTIPELREEARNDVLGAGKSFKAIFGMGHHSIAEHIYLNFDIMDVSRHAVEKLELKRNQGYTEKSQRYVTLNGDFYIPQELVGTPFESRFMKVIELQNKFYFDNFDDLFKYHDSQNYTDVFNHRKIINNREKQIGLLEGYAKEDARYSLAMATTTQLGMSANARDVEIGTSALRSSDVAEEREIGEKMFAEVKAFGLSIINYMAPSDYFSKTRNELSEYVSELLKNREFGSLIPSYGVRLHTELKRDDSILAGLLFSSDLINYDSALNIVRKLPINEILKLQQIANKYRTVHDPFLREYELGDRVAEFMMSSSAFAQLKRHRPNTIIKQKYNFDLGITVPSSVHGSGSEEALYHVINKTNELYVDMIQAGVNPKVAEYIFTNAHRRLVLLDANNRQVGHICAERENIDAQWDIRGLVTKYHELIEKESPLTSMYFCGKHEFSEKMNHLNNLNF